MKSFDAIIIGSGIAGLNSALQLATKGWKVAVITKKKLAATATNYAQGGIAAVLAEDDNVDAHVEDTLIAGSYHNKKAAVKFMVTHSRQAVERLIELGVKFATLDGELLLTREGGHRARRIAFVSDFTGKAIESVLVRQAKKHPSISLFEHTFAYELIVKNNTCQGVIVEDEKGLHEMRSGSVILACGGAGQVFSHTTNPTISTGDGYALAYEAGCRMKDMEFVQFHPTAFFYKNKPRFLISEAVRGEGAYLRNSTGERFMDKYDKRLELAPRDIVSQSIFTELEKGPVYLDMRHHSEESLNARFPQISAYLKKYGYNFAKDLIPITPAAHYMCGGIEVDLYGRTSVENLFAYGEVAYTGVHGANRLASNSLLEALVFSNRVVEVAQKSTSKTSEKKGTLPRVVKLTQDQKNACKKSRNTLRKTMWQYVGIVRTSEGLQTALSIISKLKVDLQKTPSPSPTLRELENMLTTAELITKAAFQRKKSLGCHLVEATSKEVPVRAVRRS